MAAKKLLFLNKPRYEASSGALFLVDASRVRQAHRQEREWNADETRAKERHSPSIAGSQNSAGHVAQRASDGNRHRKQTQHAAVLVRRKMFRDERRRDRAIRRFADAHGRAAREELGEGP